MPPLTLLLSSTSCFLGFSKVRQTFLLQFACLWFGEVSNNFHLCLHAFGGATNLISLCEAEFRLSQQSFSHFRVAYAEN